ncbi:hypothetical protein [Micromonospora sp. NPDC047730]|uniref:hypothetical protein n=1 Tax=Micromonospora sp. NPDC047730 TaxID=3364253 RepID=UPI0037218040
MERFFVADGALYGPPPPAYCELCKMGTQKVVTSTPHGWAWQCRRCMTICDEHRWEFDPTVAPDGRAESMLAIKTLQQLVIGLRQGQEGPIDPEDLYEVVRPYFAAGWCVRDVHYALSHLPDGEEHEDSGWNSRLPRKYALYRVRRRLRAWRWSDREDSDEDHVLEGGWTSMRKAMERAAREQAAHRAEIENDWHMQRTAARAAVNGGGRATAQAVAAGIAARSRLRKSQSRERELANVRRELEEARHYPGPLGGLRPI